MLKGLAKRLLFTPKFYPTKFKKINYSNIRPFFGYNFLPTGGPVVRTRRMTEVFGNYLLSPNIIYAQSWWNENLLTDAIRFKENNNVVLIMNQNGWYYPGWYNGNFNHKNNVIKSVHEVADFIIFQSRFCLNAGKLLSGISPKDFMILHNATPHSTKLENKEHFDGNKFTIWLSGVFTPDSQHILEPALLAVEALAEDVRDQIEVKLILGGYFTNEAKKTTWYNSVKLIIDRLIKSELCYISGIYKVEALPDLMRNVDVALHLKYKDPCPNAVVERMAFGIPHVYSNSGGTPELIGDAGIGLPVKDVWDTQVSVDINDLIDGMKKIMQNRSLYSHKAIIKSKEFGWDNYICCHNSLFRSYLRNIC